MELEQNVFHQKSLEAINHLEQSLRSHKWHIHIFRKKNDYN